MKHSQEIWAIIPTRGGSTGLPEKNTRLIAGKPLLHYMLQSALGARCLHRLILTTDSDAVASVASQVGSVEVRKHNPLFSVSGRESFFVFKHTLEALMQESGMSPRVVLLLRVTTPLCLSSDIDNAVSMLLGNNQSATAVLSVTKSDVHPQRVYHMDTNGVLRAREETPEKDYPLPRQVFDCAYIRNGALYATFPEIVLRGSLWGNKPLAYLMPKERSININDEIDFVLAEELLRRRQKSDVLSP